jgi:hypothetical protein
MQPPRARFEALSHDFGRVEQGAVVRHAFRFRNEGEVPLSVVGLRNACDCTAAVVGSETFAAGAGGAVEVSFDTAAVHGAQQRTVTVYSNDPEQRVLILTLRGEVGLDVAVDPSELYVGSLPRGAVVEQDVAVLSRPGTHKVTSIESSGRVIKVVPAEEGQLALAVALDAPLGDFAEDVLLYTMSHRRPLLRLHVRGTVEPDVTVSPAELTFDPATQGAVRHALVTNLRADRPIRVTAAALDGSLGEAEVKAVIEGLRYRVEVRLNGRRPGGEQEGTLVLSTSHPEQSRIEVPVRFREQRRPDGSPRGNDGRGG